MIRMKEIRLEKEGELRYKYLSSAVERLLIEVRVTRRLVLTAFHG